jgi:hypothetical protein
VCRLKRVARASLDVERLSRDRRQEAPTRRTKHMKAKTAKPAAKKKAPAKKAAAKKKK